MGKRALWLAAVAALSAGLPLAAQAGDEGWYLGIGAGANWLEDSDIGNPFGTGDTDIEFEIGWLAVLRGGYDYGNGWRTEIEVGYRDNDIDNTNPPNAFIGNNGDSNIFDAMVNVLYAFDTGTMIKPYLGAGVGVAHVEFDSNQSDEDTVFAFQGIAGLEYWVDDNVSLFGEYRYFGTDDPDFKVAGISFDADIDSHSALVGFRYQWKKPKPAPEPVPEIKRAVEEPPPPPPPPPAEEEIPRNFIIFFDWDQDVITPEALTILTEAADYAKRAGVARIVITGHADRSGSTKYNEGLSLRRANNASSELVSLGIPADVIAVFAKGETEPLVPTEDGVREPQNRRVEIVLE